MQRESGGDANIPLSGALSQLVGGHSDFVQRMLQVTLTPGTSDISCSWDATWESGGILGVMGLLSLYFSL